MEQDLEKEFSFQFSRSGGPGGQNVNKVATKAELRFHLDGSALLTEGEKAVLKEKLANHLTSDGYLLVVSQSERSQLANKEECIRKFYNLIRQALVKPKPRKKSKPSFSAVRKRLEAKKRHSEKKASRNRSSDF